MNNKKLLLLVFLIFIILILLLLYNLKKKVVEGFSPVYVLGNIGMGPWGGRSSRYFASDAKWIWNTPGANKSASVNVKVSFHKNYYSSRSIRAKFHVNIDNMGEIFINNSKIATYGGGWAGDTGKFNVNLKPGLNNIKVIAWNLGGGRNPAGLIVTCYDESNNVLFKTDSSWNFTNPIICARSYGAVGPRSGISIQSMYRQGDQNAMCPSNKPVCIGYTPGRMWGNCIGNSNMTDKGKYANFGFNYKPLPGGNDCAGYDLWGGQTAYQGGTLQDCMNYCSNSKFCAGISYYPGTSRVNSRCAPKGKGARVCKRANSRNGYTYYNKYANIVSSPMPAIPPKTYQCQDPNYPYRAYNGKICYSTISYAENRTGPCDSWCTNDPKISSGCGDPSKKMCNTYGRRIIENPLCNYKKFKRCYKNMQNITKILVDNEYSYIFTDTNSKGIKISNMGLINKRNKNIDLLLNIIGKEENPNGNLKLKTTLNPENGITIDKNYVKYFKDVTSIYLSIPISESGVNNDLGNIEFINECSEKNLTSGIKSISRIMGAGSNSVYIKYLNNSDNSDKSDYCLTLKDNLIANGTQIILKKLIKSEMDPEGFNSQQWIYESGYIKYAQNPKYCVTLDNNTHTIGKSIILYNIWEIEGYSRDSIQFKSQQWSFENGYFKSTSDKRYCLSVKSSMIEKKLPVKVLGSIGMNPWGYSWGSPSNYSQDAKWIWNQKNANKTAPVNKKITFLYSYNSSENINADLHCSIDNDGEIYINNIKITSNNANSNKHDIKLKSGKNIIKIIAWNMGNTPNPAGILVSAYSKKEKTLLFKSDDNWKYLASVEGISLKDNEPIVLGLVNSLNNKENKNNNKWKFQSGDKSKRNYDGNIIEVQRCKVDYGVRENCEGIINPKYICPREKPICLGYNYRKNKIIRKKDLGTCQPKNQESCKKKPLEYCFKNRRYILIMPANSNVWYLPSWNSCDYNWKKTWPGTDNVEKIQINPDSVAKIGTDITCQRAKQAKESCNLRYAYNETNGAVFLKKGKSKAKCQIKINNDCSKYPDLPKNTWLDDDTIGGPSPSTYDACYRRKNFWKKQCKIQGKRNTTNINMKYTSCDGKIGAGIMNCCPVSNRKCNKIIILGNKFIRPIQNQELAYFMTSQNYCLRFVIKPLGTNRNWSNVLHSNIANGDCCNEFTRAPGIWFIPGTTKLHCRVATSTTPNDGINSSKELPLNQETQVIIKASPGQLLLQFYTVGSNNLFLSQLKSQSGDRGIGNTRFYVSDPWYPPANTLIKNIEYLY